MRTRALGQSLAQHERDAAFADVRTGRMQGLVFEDELHIYLHRLAEVAAPLLQHEVQRGMEAARRIQTADRLLQNEIRAHAKCILRGCTLPIQYCERHRILIAGSISETLQQREAASQIVAFDNDGIELVGDQNVRACSSVGRITRTSSGSWLRRSDSNVMQ